MRVLVTGGCGFIGSAVVRHAVERGDHVLNIDRRRKITPAPALASAAGKPGYARLEADISDRALMRAVFREFGPEAVIHLSASIDAEPGRLIDTEIGGAFAVMEAARAHFEQLEGDARDRFRIVQALRAAPDTPSAPTPLEAARSAAASLADHWSRAHGLPLVNCTAGEVFGPWQADGAFLPNLVSSLLGGRSIVLQSAGETLRDWLPVNDFASGLLCAAQTAPPQSHIDFSVGACRRDIDIADAVCVMLDSRAPLPDDAFWAGLVDVTGEPPEAGHESMLDPNEAERELGWRPRGFHSGLDRMLVWALSRYARTTAAPQPQPQPQIRAVAAE
jgi:dTDP-glucose 4,6-dehydratase